MGGIELGKPTEYDFTLPRLRRALTAPHLPAGVDRLLDFGCGDGANTVLFADAARRVTGVDVEQERVNAARGHAIRLGLSNVDYVTYDGTRLPFDDHTFGYVVSFEVLEHTGSDAAALAEIRRVMLPDSSITLSVPNKWFPVETHGFHLRPGWIKWNRVPFLSWLPRPLHERCAKARIYTRRRILRLLDDAGFEVVEHRYLMPPLDKIRRPAVRRAGRAVTAVLERTPARVFGVAHVITARATPAPR
jgi:SAM-dependent methyltransferase